MITFFEALMRVFINLFILSMLFWMIFWDMEPANPIRKYWIPKIQWVFIWLGLNSQWQMFAPDPPRRTIWPLAKITLKNMEIVYWEPKPYAQMGGFEKIRLKKFHNHFHEMVRPQSGEQLKQDFVDYLLHKKNLKGSYIKVELYLTIQPTLPFHLKSSESPIIDKQLVYTLDHRE
ncbi:MAG: hypothetical protein AAFZ35_05535 [Cyanobacteria bacterium J06649_12]